jgi:hypothetical protein
MSTLHKSALGVGTVSNNQVQTVRAHWREGVGRIGRVGIFSLTKRSAVSLSAASSQRNLRSPSEEIPCTVLNQWKYSDSADASDALQCARTLTQRVPTNSTIPYKNSSNDEFRQTF